MVKYPHATIGELCRIEKGETGIASATPGEYPLALCVNIAETPPLW